MEMPIAIQKDANSVYGVTVPDVPGCYSWGDTIDDAIKNAKEAIYLHYEVMAESGDAVTIKASKIEDLATNEEFIGAIWALVDVDASKFDSKPERINISIPRFVLRKIDSFTESKHETRSGFISRAALAIIAEETEEA